jgi:c-di-AMP phosphodiesterase-like protein
MARFAMSVYKKHSDGKIPPNQRVSIVTDLHSETLAICMAQLKLDEIYSGIFIGREAAQDLITSETILVICDVNNPAIYESPELASSISDIAILDHHRLASTLPFEPFLQYIETTKSSASEIVTEILFNSQYSDDIQKGEAELLLAGIMLDTNCFTRNAGAQTFDMAHNLYIKGAHTEVVRELFNESIEDLMLSGEFESKARIYRDSVAITWMNIDRPGEPNDRIVASKVADKLLKIKGVQASFALIKLDGNVIISGRSKGNVNVQLILERLKGGGHFDAAGAQVNNSSIEETCETLKDAIDNYFEYDHRHDIGE